MRVFLDDQPIPSQAQSIGEAIACARAQAEQQGRVVIEAMFNGVPMSDRELASPSATLAEGEARFASACPGELVSSTFLGVAGALSEARMLQKSASDAVQLGQIESAMGPLSEALAIWETARRALDDGLSLAGMTNDARVHEAVGALAGQLSELKRALSIQDWSLLADALGYDMQDQADRWKVLMETLAQEALTKGRMVGAGRGSSSEGSGT